jgi:hypothetical protein
MKKKSCSLIIVVLTLFVLNVNIFAEDFAPGYPLRWNFVSYYSPAGHNRCDVPCANLGLDSTYSGNYQNTLSNWSLNSNNYVLSYNTLPEYSKVDFSSYATAEQWPALFGSSTAAFTLHYDSVWDCFETDGEYAADMKIHYVQIVTNPGLNYYVVWIGTDKVLGHELGHAVGMGHTLDTSTASIMRNGQVSWNTPQDYDRSVLSGFYN